MLVRMELSRILIRELSDYQLIELREVNDDGTAVEDPRSFPIVIGMPEAQAIERRLQGLPMSRPQTHDLLASVINAMGGTLDRITITDLTDQTFFAELSVTTADGGTIGVDCRPSDAIALGVASETPIYVAEHVLDNATRDEA